MEYLTKNNYEVISGTQAFPTNTKIVITTLKLTTAVIIATVLIPRKSRILLIKGGELIREGRILLKTNKITASSKNLGHASRRASKTGFKLSKQFPHTSLYPR